MQLVFPEIQSLISAVLGGAVAAFLAVPLYFMLRESADAHPQFLEPVEDVAVLVRDGVVVDISSAAKAILPQELSQHMDWADLIGLFAERFGQLPGAPPSKLSEYPAIDPEDPGVLHMRPVRSVTRIWLEDRPAHVGDIHLLKQHARALARHDVILDALQTPTWLCDEDGHIQWRSTSYKALEQRQKTREPLFPLKRDCDGIVAETMRTRLDDPDTGEDHWYSVTVEARGPLWVCCATNIDVVVEAEIARRNYVQTFTKTFAHLPIGLAIFDRKRQLALFNPALIDLTALPAEFLAARPNIMTFFDQLREARMMPEPKNYASWREQISDLVKATCDDRFSETWTLPSGLTYKITGRPHPDGAIAFSIEDISAEISLTRRFRSELAQSQSVLDALHEGVAVFSQLGILTMCNKAYRDMWGTDPDASFSDISIIDEIMRWQSNCDGEVTFSDVSAVVLGSRSRGRTATQIKNTTTGAMLCEAVPLTGGATLVRFHAAMPLATPRDLANIAKVS